MGDDEGEVVAYLDAAGCVLNGGVPLSATVEMKGARARWLPQVGRGTIEQCGKNGELPLKNDDFPFE